MLTSDCLSPQKMVSLDVLMVGFDEADLSSSCRSVFTSLDPKASVEWVTTLQEGMAQIELGNRYEVIVLDCRKAGGVWEEICQRVEGCQGALILGVIAVVEKDVDQNRLIEDVVGSRVDETLAPTVLKWVLRHAQERQQFLVEQEQLRGQLGEAAYKSEMADVASTVLHNVGNVLTSVTVAANMVESVVDQSSVTLVNRMAELIKAHDADLGTYLTEDPKGKRIPPSLEKLGAHLIEEQRTILKEMKGLVRNIRHMKQIILSHQTMAKSSGQTEQISLVDVVSHAMELSFQPEDDKWITICRDYQKVPTVWADQHQLLQILVNLLRNAKQAMRQHTLDRHELTLNVKLKEDDERSVVMTIQDSGIGIAPEHMSKMFVRGFTTKSDGNGIGLHSSIVAIKNMGGLMVVHSDGIGRGATFTLTFPVQKETVSS